jgi:anti-sigma B factor antagonist
MRDEFTVRPHERDGSLEVAVAGDLDMAAAFKLESAVEPALAAGDVAAVVVDLADVQFVDSAGLGALLAIRERAQDLGIDVTFARTSDPVRRILSLTGLTDVLGR